MAVAENVIKLEDKAVFVDAYSSSLSLKDSIAELGIRLTTACNVAYHVTADVNGIDVGCRPYYAPLAELLPKEQPWEDRSSYEDVNEKLDISRDSVWDMGCLRFRVTDMTVHYVEIMVQRRTSTNEPRGSEVIHLPLTETGVRLLVEMGVISSPYFA